MNSTTPTNSGLRRCGCGAAWMLSPLPECLKCPDCGRELHSHFQVAEHMQLNGRKPCKPSAKLLTLQVPRSRDEKGRMAFPAYTKRFSYQGKLYYGWLKDHFETL